MSANPRTLAKIAARIQERAAHCLEFEVKDPRAAFVTLTRVEVSKDLANAKIFYSVLGSAGERSKTEHMLASAGGFVQRKVAGVLRMRRVPRLSWVYDESIARAAEMDRMIHDALDRDRRIQATGRANEVTVDELPEEWEEEYEEMADEDEAPPPSS